MTATHPVHAAAELHAARGYRWGTRDCITLAEAVLDAAGHAHGRLRPSWAAVSHGKALQAARERFGSVGTAYHYGLEAAGLRRRHTYLARPRSTPGALPPGLPAIVEPLLINRGLHLMLAGQWVNLDPVGGAILAVTTERGVFAFTADQGLALVEGADIDVYAPRWEEAE